MGIAPSDNDCALCLFHIISAMTVLPIFLARDHLTLFLNFTDEESKNEKMLVRCIYARSYASHPTMTCNFTKSRKKKNTNVIGEWWFNSFYDMLDGPPILYNWILHQFLQPQFLCSFLRWWLWGSEFLQSGSKLFKTIMLNWNSDHSIHLWIQENRGEEPWFFTCMRKGCQTAHKSKKMVAITMF